MQIEVHICPFENISPKCFGIYVIENYNNMSINWKVRVRCCRSCSARIGKGFRLGKRIRGKFTESRALIN